LRRKKEFVIGTRSGNGAVLLGGFLESFVEDLLELFGWRLSKEAKRIVLELEEIVLEASQKLGFFNEDLLS
jgi:hypothetical protein